MTEIIVEELHAPAGRRVGHVRLNVESTLNSLSLGMVRALTPVLEGWAERPDVGAVLITANGDRAFCAGGDIQALYRAVTANHAANRIVDSYPFEFFAEEYRLDYLLHVYPKPVVCVGHGVVMGGGLGIFSAASHRVLTERSRLAVPEITIGLFPDAGATWSLGHMPRHWASFLGLTGSHMNAADALACGLGNYVVGHDERERVASLVTGLTYDDDAADNRAALDAALAELERPGLAASELVAVPERQVHVDDFPREIAAIQALAGASPWVDKGLGNLARGCPATAGIVVEQLRRVDALSLADTFRLELTVATHCAQNPDFAEGVRALLIDKDNQPRWRYGSLDALPWSYVLSHFEPPWSAHPLADLGRT